MAATVPTVEPASVTAGDTVKWSRSFADYSAADGWTLKYRCINAAGKFDITAGASGADHLVNVAAATSAGWAAGLYGWIAYVEKGAERYTVGTGSIQIEPNLAAQASGFETRTLAKQTLDDLEAASRDYAHNGQGHVQRYTIGGREMWFKSADDFIIQIEYWRGIVASEAAAQSMAQGRGNPRRLLVRFG